MNKGRLEAFSDGVFAIIITIMVLELKAPEGTNWAVIKPLLPIFLSYILSFIYVGIYWNNHHHLLKTLKNINGGVMWANMHLLFWLSLVPFVTGWMGVNNFDRISVATYGVLLLLCGLAFSILMVTIIKGYREETPLIRALKKDNKRSVLAVIFYICSIPIALYIHPGLAALFFVAVAIMWLLPNKAIEKVLSDEGDE